MKGRKPERKPFGRDGPRKGYPKDQSAYADPENWRYPLHTPWHARAARRYFDEWSNRGKYTEQERTYIDWRIDEALKKLGAGSGAAAAKSRPTPAIPARKKADELSLTDLLRIFLGQARLKRASEIDDSLVSIHEKGPNEFDGRVKDYIVRIDVENRVITHDCEDWRKNSQSKLMCKHLGKFFMKMNSETSTRLLRQILEEKEKWTFSAP